MKKQILTNLTLSLVLKISKRSLFFLTASLCLNAELSAQTTYNESASPVDMPLGIFYQEGPGSGNSANWAYPYGIKLTVNNGNYRNFELCTTTYPSGKLVFRQFNPGLNLWNNWRQLVMLDENGSLATTGNILANGLSINQSSNTDWAVQIFNTGGAGKGLKIKCASGDDRTPIAQMEDNNGNIRMVVQTNGNCGIGTSNPQNALDVNGTIRAREIVVDNTNWADYVFLPTYRLKPLTEVEQYIKTHGHLENIPTAKEVERDGVNLGDMQKNLLEKLEETTLYLIELTKQIETLKKENEELKKKIELK